MPKKKKKVVKTKKSDNPYTIHFTLEERERIEKFAKSHGYRTTSRLIKEALNIVIMNPSLLEPTENKTVSEFLDKARESLSTQQELFKSYFDNMESRIDKIEQVTDRLALNSGISEKELKQIKKKEESGEAVFE